MNRSILIVICDFLLLSLLAFSTVDINQVTNDNGKPQVKLEMAAPVPDSRQDLGSVMKLALDEERKHQESLMGELNKAHDEMAKQQALLSDREKQVQSVRQDLQAREQETQQLHEQQTTLQQQYAAAQTNLQNLNQQLQSSSMETLISKEKYAAMEAEARKQMDQAKALQDQLVQLSASNQTVLSEKQQLANQLLVAETEKRAATEQAARMQEEVKAERQEKAQLAEGVKNLAGKSGELAQEIRDNRALAPNTIFSEFLSNRVSARFNALRSGIFGLDASKHKDTKTVLVTDGAKTYALCHVEDTPLTFMDPGTDWDGFSGTLGRHLAVMAIPSISFHQSDPRVILMPVTQEQAREFGCKVYHISTDPYKFQDAVLVGAREGYYGECKFQIDLSTPDYLKMDHNSLKGLFGKFNPSSGDLVFSKNGQLLGIMANNSHCLLIRDFKSVVTFRFGQDLREQHTGATLSRFYAHLLSMPFRLQ